MTTAGLWKYGDWRHVATGCTAVVYSAIDVLTVAVETDMAIGDMLRQQRRKRYISVNSVA